MDLAKLFFITLLSLLFLTCTPQKKLRRLVKKNPELVMNDTIIVKDTVIVPKDSISEVYVYETFLEKIHDTVRIENEKVRVQIVRELDSVVIYAECKPDTIYTTNEVVVEKIVYPDDKTNWGLIVLIGLIIFGVVFAYIIFKEE